MKKTKSLVSALLCIVMILSMVTIVPAAETTPELTFINTSDEGDNAISMSDQRSFEATAKIDQDVAAEDIIWTLTREEGFLNEDLFPNQYVTTADNAEAFQLENWKTLAVENSTPVFTDKPLFQNIETTVENGTLQLTFSNDYFVMDTKNISYSYNRYVMDYIGYYDLSATLADGTVLASCEVKFNMYDSFHTMDEIYAELDEITAAAADLDNLYIEQNSMGKSTSGYDMPYVIVAKDETVAANWLKLTEEAETDPAAVIEKIQNGTLTDYQVPVLFSNIHANETPCVDASINLLWTLIDTAKQGNDATISMNTLTGFTEAGMAEFEKEAAEKSLAIPELIQNLYGDNVMDAYLGWLTEGNTSEDTWGGGYFSGPIDLDEYYTQQEETVVLSDLLDDIFFIIVPEENVEGRTYLTRTSAGGFDLNRDNSFQTQAETQNMTQLIATYNPVTFVELHGYVEAFQCEPCDPPHEPNFEYDLLSNHLMYGGVAFGNGAVANNPSYNSYVIPQRDYLAEQTDGSVFWEEPWDDMSTSYTPQYAMLHGTVSYTVECPAGNEDTTTALMYGELNHARYVAENKESYLLDQLEIFKRGVTNANSNEEVAPYYSDQQDIAGAEADIFRPVYDGEGENGNFYPECYIIPLDGENQTNLAAAYNMAEWLVRNDVKVTYAEKEFIYDGVTYPAGTMVVPMYQAKRSVANGTLNQGTLITNWTMLYSEPITAFNYTRGFDMVTVAEPAEYTNIIKACGPLTNKAATAEGAFDGVRYQEVIISNASVDSTAAVNALLKDGKTVGMITSGDCKGDFITSYENYLTVNQQYVLTAIGINDADAPEAKVIEGAPSVYLNGKGAKSSFGYVDYVITASCYGWNYDRQAMEMMNFNITEDASKADVIVGNSAIDKTAVAAIKKGTPYIGYTTKALQSVSENILPLAFGSVKNAMDALAYVTYEENGTDSDLTTASYVADGDNVLYGYGCAYFESVPEGGQVLVRLDSSKPLLEGFVNVNSGNFENFYGDPESPYTGDVDGANSIQAIAYIGADKDGKTVDLTLFANSLTNKMHQQDEFEYISNTIFAKMLGETYQPAA